MDITALAAEARRAAVDRLAEEEIANQQGAGLLTPDMARERVAADFNKALDDFSVRIIQGLAILQGQYGKLKGAPGHEAPIAFLEPDFFPARQASVLPSAPEGAEDTDLAEAWGIGLDQLSAAHDLAAVLFDEGRFEDASHALFALGNIAPGVPELAAALGHAEYRCGRLDAAVQCYGFAHLGDPSNPAPLIHAAFCLQQQGHRSEALECLDKADDINREAPDAQVTREIAELRAAVNA